MSEKEDESFPAPLPGSGLWLRIYWIFGAAANGLGLMRSYCWSRATGIAASRPPWVLKLKPSLYQRLSVQSRSSQVLAAWLALPPLVDYRVYRAGAEGTDLRAGSHPTEPYGYSPSLILCWSHVVAPLCPYPM